MEMGVDQGLVKKLSDGSQESAQILDSFAWSSASFCSVRALFQEMDGSAKSSIDSLIDTLKGQVSYMETYNENIKKAMEMSPAPSAQQAAGAVRPLKWTCPPKHGQAPPRPPPV